MSNPFHDPSSENDFEPEEVTVDERQLLENERKRFLSKGPRKELLWIRWEQFDELLSADGNDLPPGYAEALFHFCWAADDPSALPFVSESLARLEASSRAKLANYVFESWAGSRRLPSIDLRGTARALTERQSRILQQCPEIARKWKAGAFEQQMIDNQKAYRPNESAEGVLAFVAGCGIDASAKKARDLIVESGGNKTERCRSLLRMLAGMDSPLAGEYLLAISQKFRTRTIQEEARVQLEMRARRKGLRKADFEELSIPTGGLDFNGILVLDYGPRQFTASLQADQSIKLSDQNGREIKGLPPATKQDDDFNAKAAKAQFSELKKVVKSVMGTQRTRLYEAMCSGKTWSAKDWKERTLGHPLMRNIASRLIWEVLEDEKDLVTFRPLPDGSLTSSSDDLILIPPSAKIRLAHGNRFAPEIGSEWLQHLIDYGVSPFIIQFGRRAASLESGRGEVSRLTAPRDSMIDSLILGRATQKLGYVRGATRGDAYFFEYRKNFPSMEIDMVIEFSGHHVLANVSSPVTLKSFSLTKAEDRCDGSDAARIPFDIVPPILLVEGLGDWLDILGFTMKSA